MKMICFLNVKPEDHDNFVAALEKAFSVDDADAIKQADKIRKQKKAEYDKKRYEEKHNSTVKNVESEQEEERKEEEVLPLSSPSSLLSSPSDSPNIYPITPYNPPLPEEEKREEEDFGGSDGKRGELRSFGPHVKLSEKEFLKLQEDYGYEETMRMIRSMNDYIGEDPKLIAKYRTRNHNLTLRNWKRRDDEKKKAQQPEKRESWTEIAERLSGEIDL